MMAKLMGLVAVLLASVLSLACCSNPSAQKSHAEDGSISITSADQATKKGYSLAIENRFPEAILYLNKSIQLDPEQPFAFYLRGVSYENMGKEEKAFADYTESLRLKGDNDSALYRRARLYMRQQKVEAARKDLVDALKINPDNETAHHSLGILLLSQNKPDKAVEAFNAAIKLQPTFAAPYYWRGIAYARQGKKELAEDDRRMAIDLGYKPSGRDEQIRTGKKAR